MLCAFVCPLQLTNEWRNTLNGPDHDDGEVEDVPRVPEVGVRVSHKAKSDNPHHTLAGEDHGEDHFNFFEELIDSICVPVGKGREHLGQKFIQIVSIYLLE